MASALCVALVPRTAAADPAADIPVIPTRAEVMAAATGLPMESWACSPMVATPEHADTNIRWRVEAYHHLDCAAQVIERALPSGGEEDDRVTITKDELEELRARLFWARDAAARIGR
jgi:hypothetical protein